MQRRDVGNEILVALATIGTLALALTFGIILMLTNSAPIPSPTLSVDNVATTISTMTDVAAIPTIGNVYAPTISTATATLTSTITPSVTASITATGTPSATPTDAPTKTPTRTPTVANTAVPSATPTTRPTITTTATPTLIYTSAATSVASPSNATSNAAATDYDIVVVTGVTTGIATLPPTVCSPPPTWVPYVIQAGDTLFSIAIQSNTTLAALQSANCINNPSSILYGETIYVPPASALVQPTSTAGSQANGQANGCANAATRITSPRSGATLRGTITVSGTADIPRFAFYKVEVRADGDSVWKNFAQNGTPVDNGALGSLNTALFSNGSYWLQLTVVDNTGNIPILPCAINVRFTN